MKRPWWLLGPTPSIIVAWPLVVFVLAAGMLMLLAPCLLAVARMF